MIARSVVMVSLTLGLLVCPASLFGADWPMDRYDAQRSAASPQQLAARLNLQWVRHLPPLQPAWPDQPSLQFDAAYVPVVLGKTLFIGSSRTDSITALDTETGAEKWMFVADGPIRFAPVAWENKIYVVSDDGHLYCVSADTGRLIWKCRGGPQDRNILGNGRLISTWPARGGPVLVEGKIYFTASIWPFMGIFIHALDARTGQVIWTNDGDGAMYIQQPHHAEAFAGVAPQGALVAVGDKLLLPGGRSVPACYDRHAGKFLHYRLADNSGTGGGSEVAALGPVYCNGGAIFDLDTGNYLEACGKQVVLSRDMLYTCSAGECQAFEVNIGRESETYDRKGKLVKRPTWTKTKSGSVPLPGVEALIKAGSRLYAGSANQVCAIELPLQGGASAISWQAVIEGKPARLLAADDRLFVVTHEGGLYCFGEKPIQKARTFPAAKSAVARADAWTRKVERILEASRARAGYAIVLGVGSGGLITELVRQSQLHLIVIDPDASKVQRLREELLGRDLYGERVSVHVGNPETFALPPYLANLVVAEETSAIDTSHTALARIFQALRPYGGMICLPVPSVQRQNFARCVAEAKLAQGQVREAGDWLMVVREGALPGSGNWTHEHADAANSRFSRDKLVQTPLGILWFGGSSHQGILPRHGHGPQPQVIDGRLIIEGMDMLRAMDIYTGRILWQADLPGFGQAYNNLAHHPGANASGTNYVSTSDGIYVSYGKACLRLDPATGKQMNEIKLPAMEGEAETPRWCYLNILDDYLVAGANYLPEDSRARSTGLSSSKQLLVLNRHSGRVLWSVAARSGFRHNGICLGGGRLYCIDRPSADHLARLKRRGETPQSAARLIVLDLATGKEIWNTDKDVFGTWLSYSARYDVLVEAGSGARDTLADEAHGMRAYRGSTGNLLWHQPTYVGPAMMYRDTILKDHSACDLLTGLPRLRTDPLTGLAVEWTWSRGYGCNTPLASENLLTFRSGAAGFFDLANDGGTGNFGGFRSGCTNNLIVAGGVLAVPDYTRTCTCSYQNQASLALVHMPENEMWTYPGSQAVAGPVKRLGINLGAPGSRKARNGTLWLEYPHVGGPSPSISVQASGKTLRWFRRHGSQIQGDGLKWVAASGVEGLDSLTITLDKQAAKERRYTVRLHFVEPRDLKPAQRVFHVALQGRPVLQNLDIVKEAGGPQRTLVREFTGIGVTGDLQLTLAPASSQSHPPLLCGIEVVAEGR